MAHLLLDDLFQGERAEVYVIIFFSGIDHILWEPEHQWWFFRLDNLVILLLRSLNLRRFAGFLPLQFNWVEREVEVAHVEVLAGGRFARRERLSEGRGVEAGQSLDIIKVVRHALGRVSCWQLALNCRDKIHD